MIINKINSGFTLIEMIVIIIILGILSKSAIGLTSGVSDYSVYSSQEKVISIIRQIQVNRMQSNVSNPNDNLRIVILNDCLGSIKACHLDLSNSVQKLEAEARSDYIRESNINFSPDNIIIDFDLLGNPSTNSSINITISSIGSNNSSQVCINSQGYVHKGACL